MTIASLEQGDWVVALKEGRLACSRARGHRARGLAHQGTDRRLDTMKPGRREPLGKRFEGLRDGLAVVAEMCDRYWDSVYPRINWRSAAARRR